MTLGVSDRSGLRSDPYSLADIFDCLVHTGVCGRLESFATPQVSRTTGRLVSAVQRLLKQMGDSLVYLTLYSGPLCEQQQTCEHTPTALATTAAGGVYRLQPNERAFTMVHSDHYIDVSNNVALKELRLVVQLDSCIPMLMLLIHVTSQHMTDIQIEFFCAPGETRSATQTLRC